MRNKKLENKIKEMQPNATDAMDDMNYFLNKPIITYSDKENLKVAKDYIFTYISFLEIALGEDDE